MSTGQELQTYPLSLGSTYLGWQASSEQVVQSPAIGWVNVKAFGALGNGSANDTVAVQDAIDFMASHRTTSSGFFGGMGTLYFPAGNYVVTTLTLTNAQGLILQGDGVSSVRISFNSATAAFITVNAWIWLFARDIAFVNLSATGYGSQTSILFNMTPTSAGTGFHASNCRFENCGDMFYVGGSVNGDTFLFDHCTFSRGKNAWRTANTQAVDATFINCTFGNLTVSIINVTGTGMIHIESPNIADVACVFKLIPALASYGGSSRYTATNCRMEWQSPAPQWIDCYTTDDFLAQLVFANFVFTGCSLDGGTGGAFNLATMKLSGLCSVVWNGGFYGGTVQYRRNAALQTTDNLSNSTNARTEIKFCGGVGNAPLPSDLIVDGSGGEPVFVYQGCANRPDMEFGGNIGATFRAPHTWRWQPALGQVATNPGTNPYRSSISFFGRTVRLGGAMMQCDSSPVGTNTATIYSDAGYTVPLGTVTWVTTGASYNKLVLTADPTIVVGTLYVEYFAASVASVPGYWVFDYTVLV